MTETEECLRARKRACLMLVRNEDQITEENNDVVVGSRVSQAAVRRSGLLSGIEHTSGQAPLPSQLSPEDIRLWETTCIVDVEFPLDELITVLKVADAFGDEKSASWIDKLGKKVAATDWQHAQQADAMLCALLRLPPHLLPSVLASKLQNKSLDRILSTFPAALHLAAVSAAVQRGPYPGSLDFQHDGNAAAALHLVATSSVPLTLRKLTIGAEQSAQPPPTAPAALLARAAAGVSSLTSLKFVGFPVTPAWLRSFSACLPPDGLHSIHELYLSTDGLHAGCVEIISCLSRLPALTELNIDLSLPKAGPPAEVSLAAYTRLVATPAVLPQLRSIWLDEGLYRSVEHVNSPSSASTFLPLISAPALVSLNFGSRAAFPSCRSLMETITRFTAMQDLHLEVALAASDRAVGLESFPQLPPLKQATATSTCPVSAVNLATTIVCGASASLTSLEMYMDQDASYCDAGFRRGDISTAWQSCFRALRTCSRLACLTLNGFCGVPPGTYAGRVFREGLEEGLSPLTGLTSLDLREFSCRLVDEDFEYLHGGSVGRVVAALPKLHTLSFTSDDAGRSRLFDEAQPVLDACARLTGLEVLTMQMSGVTPQQVEGYLAQQTALKRLELAAEMIEEWATDEDFQAMKARFPNVTVCVT